MFLAVLRHPHRGYCRPIPGWHTFSQEALSEGAKRGQRGVPMTLLNIGPQARAVGADEDWSPPPSLDKMTIT